MAKAKFKVNKSGVIAVLQSAGVASVVETKARQVQANAQMAFGPAADGIMLDRETTDRARFLVTIRDPKAKAAQATSGVLFRAATAAGLDVRPPKRGVR